MKTAPYLLSEGENRRHLTDEEDVVSYVATLSLAAFMGYLWLCIGKGYAVAFFVTILLCLQFGQGEKLPEKQKLSDMVSLNMPEEEKVPDDIKTKWDYFLNLMISIMIVASFILCWRLVVSIIIKIRS